MKKVIVSMLSVLAVIGFISCGSKPVPEEPKKEAPVVEEPASVVDDEPVVEEPAEEIDETGLYSAQIEDARKLALEAGAAEKAADLLKAIDDYYASISANGKISAEDAAELVKRYKALASYIKAKDAKEKIDANGLASESQRDYDAGVAFLNTVEEAYGSDAAFTDAVFEAADKAYSSFNAVLVIAYKNLAKQERDAAFQAKKQADSVKAGVSRKEQYSGAVEKFQKGDALYSMQSPEKAYENYVEAKKVFLALYEDVSEKRAAAQAALEAAKKRVEESASFADEADARAPIGDDEELEGIEEEDAVLLEEDTYEAPEAAVIEIPETIDGDEEGQEE